MLYLRDLLILLVVRLLAIFYFTLQLLHLLGVLLNEFELSLLLGLLRECDDLANPNLLETGRRHFVPLEQRISLFAYQLIVFEEFCELLLQSDDLLLALLQLL